MAQFYTDFAKYTTSSEPSDWTDYWTATTFVVGSDAGYTGGKYCALTELNAYTRTGYGWDTVGSSDADLEIVFRFNSKSGGILLPALRASGTTSRNGYVLLIRNDTNVLDIRRSVNNTETSLGTQAITINDNTLYWVRFRINGDDIKVRFWADGDAEPASWTKEITDSSGSKISSAGRVQLGTTGNTSSPFWIDVVGVGTNGDTAPTEALTSNGERGLYIKGATASSSNWYNESWTKRVKVTVDHTKVGATLSDFPVYIDLSELPADFHTNVNQTDARDIRVTTSDEETEVPREVVFYDSSTDTGELHFKAPSLSSSVDTDFYIYYGNTIATEPASDSTYGSENVWSSYNVIVHFDEDPTNSNLLDSTANGNDGTPEATGLSRVTGKVGRATAHDSKIVDFGQTTDSQFGSGDFTVSLWAQKGESSSGWSNVAYIGKWNTGAQASTNEWLMGATVTGGDDKPSFSVVSGTTVDAVESATALTLDTWYYIVAKRSGGTLYLYVNGVEKATNTTLGTLSINTVNDRELKTGSIEAGTSYNLEGIIDELRIIKGTAFSVDWIGAEYNNQSAPGTFATIGTAESVPVAGDWYNASWDYRVKITVQSSQVDSTLSDFPVYVDLSGLPAGFHTNVNQTDGRDIRVTKGDGTTELPREVVFYNSATDTGELHFKADSLSSSANTEFYVYYGNASATEPTSNATYGSENVWNSNFKAVYHLQADPSGTAPQLLDSTSNSNDLTSAGSMTSGDSVAVKIGNGIDFDGSDDELVSANNIGITGAGNRTVSVWVKQPTAANKNFLGFGTTTTGGCFDMLFHSNKVAVHAYGGGFDNISSAPSYTANTLVQAYATYNGTAVNTFVNGTGGTATNMTLNTANSALRIGKGTYATLDRLTGQMDEVRVSDVVRSAYWMGAEYTNQATPTTFYSVGTQEEPSASGTDANSERGLYIEGKDTSASERGLYSSGKLSDSSERGLYSSGELTDSSDRLLYSEGSIAESSDRLLYSKGNATGDSDRLVYTKGIATSSSDRLLNTTGKLTGEGDRGLYTIGTIPEDYADSERFIYTKGISTSSSDRGLYSVGGGVVNSERGLYALAEAIGDSERGIYTTGKETGFSLRNLYTKGFNSSSSDRLLYTRGAAGGSSDRAIYSSGVLRSFSDRFIYTIGADTSSSDRRIYTYSVEPGLSERDLYTIGAGRGSSEIPIYTGGFETDSSERGVYSRGGIPSSSTRNLYTKGTWKPWVDKFVEYGTIYTDEEVAVGGNFVDLKMSGSDSFSNDSTTTKTWVDTKVSVTDNFIRKI